MLRQRPKLLFFAFCFLASLGAGCGSFGPRVLEKTHGQYNEAVHEVEKEELLRNLVRMRYNDTPTLLNLASIAAQYELTSQAEARPFFIAPNPSNSNIIFKTFTSILPDVLVTGSNRPTLSLIPGDDGEAMRQYLTPISTEMLNFLIQAGWPVSSVLRIWVERLNGVPNADTLSNPPRGLLPDYERFQRIAELCQHLQDQDQTFVHFEERLTEVSGPMPVQEIPAAAALAAVKDGLEYRIRDDGKTWVLAKRSRALVFQVGPGHENSPELKELLALLNLKPDLRHFEVQTTSGNIPDPSRVPTPPSSVLKLMPRSTAQVYYYLSAGVEVPCEHIQCGLVPLTVDESGTVQDTRAVTRGLFEVHVARGHKPPPCAFVAVRHRDYWFYIDDRDQPSKTTFGMVLQLSRLDFRRQQISSGPFLTLPAGR